MISHETEWNENKLDDSQEQMSLPELQKMLHLKQKGELV